GIWSAYAHDYGGTVIPYGVQRSLEAVTGRDLALDWADFQASLLDEALTLKARADARGGPQTFRRLTRMGGSLRSPVFLADGTLLFGANPPDGPPGLYTIAGLPAATPVPQALLRTTDVADVAVVDGDTIIFSQTETHERWYSFRDLF